MRAYGSEIHRAAGGAGRFGRKTRQGAPSHSNGSKTGGSHGRTHQDCGICHPGTKNKTARARRNGKAECDPTLLINILKDE